MKIVVIGSVAAGTSAAAKARRNTETAEIIIFDKDRDISYSGCGLPYYIGTDIKERKEITPRNADFFKKRYDVNVYPGYEVLSIAPEKKEVVVKKLSTAETFAESYDKLVISTGAVPIIPPIEGVTKSNVFPVRNVENAERIRNFILEKEPTKAVVVGAGFIGLEMVENLAKRGLEVTLIEMAPQVMPSLDQDMAIYLEKYLWEKGVKVLLNTQLTGLQGENLVNAVVTDKGEVLETDLVVLAVGVKPNVGLAVKAGVKLGTTGAIKVNEKMETNLPDIYAVGDCAESFSLLTEKPIYRPLGSTANKMGRIAGDQITGGHLVFKGILGTGIFKLFDLTVAQTGLTEKEALTLGYEVEVSHNIKPNQQAYFPGGGEMNIKAVADQRTGKLLGVQIIGKQGVDKRLDVFVTAISFGAQAADLFHLDLGYAPPFATTKDPVMYTGMVLDNALARGRRNISPEKLRALQENNQEVIIIDVREQKQYEAGHIPGAINIPLADLREKAGELEQDKTVVTYCNSGVSGNAAQNILLNRGFKEVYNLSGGHKNFFKKI